VADWLHNYVIPTEWETYTNTPYTKNQNRLKQYQLVSDSWFKLIETSFEQAQPALSANHHNLNFHTLWLERARIDKLISSADFAQLDKLHKKLRRHTKDLILKDSNESRAQTIKKITSINKQLQTIIKHYF
jgi:hypothetical protein